MKKNILITLLAAVLLSSCGEYNKLLKSTDYEYKNKREQRIVFIHGKGDGVLRKALLDELKRKYPTFRHQDASFQEYGFGATMITIK